MPGTLASALMISSVIPSLKYSFSGSALMLVSGRTAIAFSVDGPAASPRGRGAVASLSREIRRSASANAAAVVNRSAGDRASATGAIARWIGAEAARSWATVPPIM